MTNLLSTSASYVDQLLEYSLKIQNVKVMKLIFRDGFYLLYDPETSIELFRSAVETAVTSPGELVVNG